MSIWISIKGLIEKLDNLSEENMKIRWIINIIPWYSLICFGCYCLMKIGFDLLTFNDYPLEIGKLEKDIKIAENDLKNRGFTD